MARNFDIKKRGSRQRKRKAIYLIIAEGRNKTESLYLSNFQEQGKAFCIHFVKAGSNTDAESLYKTLKSKWQELGLSETDGDRGFIVLDIDNDDLKAQSVRKLIKDNTIVGINFIVSNPTFELWFLLHFKYTTKYYTDGNAVIKDLKKYIPVYEKNMDCFILTQEYVGEAIKNADKLAKNYGNERWPAKECNPRTDVGNLVELLL